MSFLKVSGIIIVIIGMCAAGYFLLPQDIEVEKESVLDQLLSQELDKAESTLAKYRRMLTSAEWNLYKGYIERKKGNLEESNKALNQALANPSENVETTVIKEIYLNKMLNAYLEQDTQQLSLVISQGRKLFVSGNQDWLNIFRGIEAYLRGNVSKARRVVTVGRDRQYHSPLMKSTFEKYFPDYWVTVFLARCEIALGNEVEAREKLELESMAIPPKGQEEVNFLIGLSYIKEGETKTFRDAVPYYKLAFGHFEKVNLQDEKHEFERDMVLKSVSGKIEIILSERSFDDLSFYSQLLVKLGANDGVAKLKERLFKLIHEETVAKSWENVEDLAEVLSGVLEKGELRDSIKNKFEEHFERSLTNLDIASMGYHWAIASLFCHDSEKLREKYSETVMDKAFEVINDDTLYLKETEDYIEFLENFEPNRDNRLLIAESLMQYGQELWRSKTNRPKAVSFLKLVENSKLIPKDSKVHERLECVFQRAYTSAVQCDNVKDLKDILIAVNELELANVDILNPGEKANQLEDAIYLFKNKNYREAKKKAKWLLKLDPENTEAKRILGLIAYDEAEYNNAYQYLKDFEPSDVEMTKVLAITYLLNDDFEKGNQLLGKLKEQNALSEEVYFKLAFGSLILDKPLSALKWFEMVDQQKPEVMAGKVFAAFEMDSWNETITLYKELPKLYKDLDGYQGIAIESYTSLGDIPKAEDMLEKLLKEPPEPSASKYPEYFQTFKREKLDQWNRYYVAALYHKIVKQDPDKALRFFDRIVNPSSAAEIEKAEIYMEKRDFYEAKRVLESVLTKVEGSDQERKINLRILPHLAEIAASMGYYPEALPLYREYFSLNPDDDTFRIPFAQVLMALKRYDLALEQFKLYRRSLELRPSDVVDYIESLVRTNDFDSANSIARDWLANSNVPLYYQIKIARLMIITQYKALIDTIFAAIAEKERRTLEENQQLILLWMDLGDYDDAISLAGIERRGLETTPEGLMVLVELNTHLSKDDDALQFAEMALQLAPTDHRIADIVEKYERTPAVIARSTKLLKDRLEDDPDSPTLQLDYAKNLIDLAVETYLSGGLEDISQSHDLHLARAVLERFTKQNQDLPEAYFLMGKVYYLLDKNEKAREAYEQALKLDVSYVKAYQHLALVYEEEDSFNEANSFVREAAKFDPTNAEVWMQLGDLLFSQKNYLDAINSLKNAKRYAPNAPEPYIKLAEVYLEAKNADFAIANLEKALELSPKNIVAIKLMLLALYDEKYDAAFKDRDKLKAQRLRFFDKLEAYSPEDAQQLREQLGDPEQQ